MSQEKCIWLANDKGDSISLPLIVAKECLGHVREVFSFFENDVANLPHNKFNNNNSANSFLDPPAPVDRMEEEEHSSSLVSAALHGSEEEGNKEDEDELMSRPNTSTTTNNNPESSNSTSNNYKESKSTTAHKEEVHHTNEEDEEEEVPLKIDNLLCDRRALELLRQYALFPPAERTAVHIPKPLLAPLAVVVTRKEMDLVKNAERDGVHVQLLDLATYLKFEPLVNLVAAYISGRIEEIAKAAPNIMTGAERIRNYLQMENEWTEEESHHLEKEMEYVLEIDPNAY